MNDDIAGLMAEIKGVRSELAHMRREREEDRRELTRLRAAFEQSKGAIGLVKFVCWVIGICAAVLAAIHGVRQ